MARCIMDQENIGRVEPDLYRSVMGKFATGIALVTATDKGMAFGMAMNSLTSVSLDPCLLLVCPRRGSATGDAIRNAGAFAISILASGQADICNRFVGKNALRFDGLDLPTDLNCAPLIPGALAQISCRVHAVYPGGDHEIVLGEVVDCRHDDGAPLIFHDGKFCQTAA